MKAWILPQYGSIDQLKLTDLADPVARDGEVVLRLRYAGLNPADRYLAEGQYPARPALPHILGRDGLGVVESVGPGVSGWSIGDEAVIVRSEIGVTRAGTFAEKVAVPTESLVRVPEGWSPAEAAGATLVYLTAYQALTQWNNEHGGALERAAVLVTGASGGVGVASVQLARAMGHTVIGLSRGDSKRQALLDLGYHHVLDPTDTQWTRQLKQTLGDRGIDLAIDNIGGAQFNDLLQVLGDFGRISCVGALAGPVPQFNTARLFFKRLRIGGVAIATFTPAESQEAWHTVVDLLTRTQQRPVVDQEFSLTDLPQAFARLKAGPLGKVLIRF